MYFHHSPTIAENASRSNHNNRSVQRFDIGQRQEQAGQQQFEKLLDDLRQCESQAESSDDNVADEVEPMLSFTDRSAFKDIDTALSGEHREESIDSTGNEDTTWPLNGENDERGHDQGETVDAPSNSPELSGLMDTSISASMDNQGLISASAEPCSIGALPLNEAAARIIEEMLARSRRGESRRWQFVLPGLAGGSVTVIIECAEDQSWHVELSTADNYPEKDKLALQQRLAERMGDVKVTLNNS